MSAEPVDLSRADVAALTRIHTLLTDIDDTLTDDGRLRADAYAALEALDEAGLRVIPITGRPAGWCDMIARFWPVAGVVGENGAFAFRYDHAARQMTRLYASPAIESGDAQARLFDLALEIVNDTAGAAFAADQAFRLADIAIDVREDVTPLAPATVATIMTRLEAAGATVKLSSIHLNAWFGDHDKLSMTRRFLAEAFGVDLIAEGERIVFVGDSPNDEPMFAALPLSVGVANVRDFLPTMRAAPRYVTERRGGAGFVELAQALLKARGA